MNWLGKIIQKQISKNDTVLDVGCGIMQATTESLNGVLRSYEMPLDAFSRFHPSRGNLKCKSLLGCDIWRKYLEISKKFFPVVNLSIDELGKFLDDSFDVVICLDVLEHLEHGKAIAAISELKRIARKKVIVYTPVKMDQPEIQLVDSWDMGECVYQKHLSLLSPSLLESLDFKVTFPEPDKNSLGIFNK